jgi:hypothetical protein
MILLASNFLFFEMPSGESIPFSPETISVDLAAGSEGMLDPDFAQHTAASVFHYFKHDLGRKSVSVAEFASAFECALQGLGLRLDAGRVTAASDCQIARDLGLLANEAADARELLFFPRLRVTVREQMRSSPRMVRFHGLRDCVKRLTGARRWSPRCERLRDQIIEFLRRSVSVETASDSCALMVE